MSQINLAQKHSLENVQCAFLYKQLIHMSNLRIRLNPYPDLKKNNKLYNQLIKKSSKNETISRLLAKTKNKKKHIRILQRDIQLFIDHIKQNLNARLQYYFKNKQISVSALDRGLLGDKHNNGKSEGFHIETLDMLIIYITNDFTATFFNWASINTTNDCTRYFTAYQIECKQNLITLDDLYAMNKNSKTSSPRINVPVDRVKKEIHISTSYSLNNNINDVKQYIYAELVKDNFQEAIDILGGMIKQSNPDLYIAVITITSDLNDLNRREIIGQLSQSDFRIGINLVKERIYKLANKVVK